MVKKLFKQVSEKVDKIDGKDVADGVKNIAKGVAEEGVEVVKTGIFGVVNGILLKIILAVTFIVIVLTAGCVGGSVAIDKLTSDTPTEQQIEVKDK